MPVTSRLEAHIYIMDETQEKTLLPQGYPRQNRLHGDGLYDED
jgi:hypothetical protein